MKWFEDAQAQMRKEKQVKGSELNGVEKDEKSEVKLDESLAPSDAEDEATYTALPDKSSPSL